MRVLLHLLSVCMCTWGPKRASDPLGMEFRGSEAPGDDGDRI